jgi:hypothetical protein
MLLMQAAAVAVVLVQEALEVQQAMAGAVLGERAPPAQEDLHLAPWDQRILEAAVVAVEIVIIPGAQVVLVS